MIKSSKEDYRMFLREDTFNTRAKYLEGCSIN